MFQLSLRSKVLVSLSALLISSALPAAVFAENAPEGLSALVENPAITFGVLSALEKDDAADVIVTFELSPSEDSRYAHHPAAGSDVHPLLFDMVSLAEPGSIRFEEVGSGFALYARMSAAALRTLGNNPDILAVELDPSPKAPEITAVEKIEAAPQSKLHCPCFPSIGSTVACLQSGQWRVSVNHGGSASRVATYSNVSAVFWTYGSTNWEIVAKVIDGCAVNNKWWVLAAGASSVPFTLRVEDAGFCPRFKTYSSTNPILDISAFDCS